MLFFTYLVKGSGRDSMPAYTEEQIDALQADHVANNLKLRDDGRSYFSGPLKDSADPRGTLLLQADSEDEAFSYFSKDPFVQLWWLEPRFFACTGDTSCFGAPSEPFELQSHALAVFECGEACSADFRFAQPALLRDTEDLAFWGTMNPCNELAAVAWFFSPPSDHFERLTSEITEVADGRVKVRWFEQLAPRGLIRRT